MASRSSRRRKSSSPGWPITTCSKGTPWHDLSTCGGPLFREALRDLLLGNNDGRSMPIDAGRTLNDVATRARLRLRMDAGGSARLEAEGASADAALGRLLVIVYRAMENDTWPRLKACREDTCQWAFFDHSKNRSGHWCSMEVCGSRNKARQYRERRRSG